MNLEMPFFLIPIYKNMQLFFIKRYKTPYTIYELRFIVKIYDILVNTIDAVASLTLLPLGNLPVKCSGSPIRVPISPDQKRSDI